MTKNQKTDDRLQTVAKTAIYDLFAEVCAYIVKTHTKNYLVKYSCISDTEQERVLSKIRNHTSLEPLENGHFHHIKSGDITDDFVNQLDLFARKLKAEDDINCAMRFLQAIDSAMADILREEIVRIQQKNHTTTLNRNREYTGIELLPRCECVWARKSRQSFSYRRLDNYLKHIMVIESQVFEDVEDEHIYLPKGFFKHFDETKKLNIAASPLTAKSNFDIKYYKKSDLQVFALDYHEETMARDNELVWQKILAASKNGTEIIVFPEMLGNATMEHAIQVRLRALNAHTRERIPALIVLPSYFEDGENYCVVLDRYGNEIARQYKQNPYIMKNKSGEYMEDIHGAHNQIAIFHYEGIGRFAILICKDFLTTRYMERIMRGFMLTMIIVPAYSTGSYDFKMSFDLCAHDYCNVVWINSCAAMVPGKESNFEYIGYVRKRIGRYEDPQKALYEMKPCPKLFHGKCDQHCIYYDSFGAT